MSTLLDIARAYWTAGLCPMPRALGEVKPSYIAASGAVCPILWGEYKTKQPDWLTVEPWFRHGDLSTIGMLLLTGSHAHPNAYDAAFLQILDFECADVWEAFLEDMHFAGHADILHRCMHERTPSGGVHLGFLCQAISDKPSVKLAQRHRDPDDPTAKTLLVELLQHQPCTVAPTRLQCKPEHPVGVPYQVTHGDWAHPLEISTDQRRILLDTARHSNEVPAKMAGTGASAGEGGRPGDKLNAAVDLAWWQDLLSRHGWRDVSRGGLRAKGVSYFQRPGKAGAQCSATYGRTGPCLYVFSGNAQPFEPDTAYAPFGAYALLEHAGDFAAAAKALAKVYPPTPEERAQWKAAHWHERATLWVGQWHTMAPGEAPAWHTVTIEEAAPWR